MKNKENIKRHLIIEKKYTTERGMRYIIESLIHDEFKKQINSKDVKEVFLNLINSK